jgi:acetolactate synthase regulatory subunit
MFYKRPSRWSRLHRHRGFQVLAAVAAGFHAANGIALSNLVDGVADRIENRL